MKFPILTIICSIAFTLTAPGRPPYAELQEERITMIERQLPPAPAGFGQPIGNRAFWNVQAGAPPFKNAVARAEPYLTMPFPEWSDELYLEFSQTGQRPGGEKMIRNRTAWLEPLVTAECLEDRGRFLPVIIRTLESYVKEPCWTLPAHDDGLVNFRQLDSTVDLRSAAFAADLAQTLYLLGDRIPPDLRSKVMATLEKRIFSPVRESLHTGSGHWWLGSQSEPIRNNWNAVCLAGVVGAARTVIHDRRDRALFLAAGEHYSEYFVNGFTEDGYCDEGPGYWIYGFGSYVALREILMDATGGRVDLFARAKTRQMALYGSRIAFPAGDAPPFADCRNGTVMDKALIELCNRIFGIENLAQSEPAAPVFKNLAWQFAAGTSTEKTSASSPEDLTFRSYFDQVGVLVCRPGKNWKGRISAAIKAGGNGSHSHNDIGSFVISLDGDQPVGDPGGPYAYDNETFGPKRFERRILNSFGHPVPVVDGQLQTDATSVRPLVIETTFRDNGDRISLDLRGAYPVPTLERLIRTLTFPRADDMGPSIEDHVVFAKPSSFEIALTTRWQFKQVGPSLIEFSNSGRTVVAEIDTPDGFELTRTEIEELGAPAFTRIGLKLRKPVTDARVRVTFRTPRLQK